MIGPRPSDRERNEPILYEDDKPKTGTLVSDQNLATVWLSTGSSVGTAFKPYLVHFKGGTAISFHKDGKVQSGTLASKQNLVKSIPRGPGKPDFVTVNAGSVVHFDKDGLVIGF